MPKVLLTAAQREADREKKRQKAFNMVLMERKADGLPNKKIADEIAVDPATFSGYKTDCGRMSLRAFRRFADAVDLTDKEILSIVKGT